MEGRKVQIRGRYHWERARDNSFNLGTKRGSHLLQWSWPSKYITNANLEINKCRDNQKWSDMGSFLWRLWISFYKSTVCLLSMKKSRIEEQIANLILEFVKFDNSLPWQAVERGNMRWNISKVVNILDDKSRKGMIVKRKTSKGKMGITCRRHQQ